MAIRTMYLAGVKVLVFRLGPGAGGKAVLD